MFISELFHTQSVEPSIGILKIDWAQHKMESELCLSSVANDFRPGNKWCLAAFVRSKWMKIVGAWCCSAGCYWDYGNVKIDSAHRMHSSIPNGRECLGSVRRQTAPLSFASCAHSAATNVFSSITRISPMMANFLHSKKERYLLRRGFTGAYEKLAKSFSISLVRNKCIQYFNFPLAPTMIRNANDYVRVHKCLLLWVRLLDAHRHRTKSMVTLSSGAVVRAAIQQREFIGGRTRTECTGRGECRNISKCRHVSDKAINTCLGSSGDTNFARVALASSAAATRTLHLKWCVDEIEQTQTLNATERKKIIRWWMKGKMWRKTKLLRPRRLHFRWSGWFCYSHCCGSIQFDTVSRVCFCCR